MKRIYILLLALLMLLFIPACGAASPSDVQDPGIAEIEAFIDQLMQTQEMKDTIEYCKANNMDHCLEARKDTFVYKYTYTVPVPDTAKDTLLAQYDSVKDVFLPIAEGIKQDVSAVKTVVWEYYNVDGTLIVRFPF